MAAEYRVILELEDRTGAIIRRTRTLDLRGATLGDVKTFTRTVIRDDLADLWHGLLAGDGAFATLRTTVGDRAG